MNDPILARGGADDERRSLSRRAFITSLAALPAIPAALIASASPAAATHPRPECVTWSDESATYTKLLDIRALRVGGLFLLTLLVALAFAAISAAQAEANSRIRSGSCDIYDINRVDPIAFSSHDHEQFMNPTTTNSSTGESLKAANKTTCKAEDNWATSAGWFPTPKSFNADKTTVYYRDPGNIKVKPIPTGLKLLSHEAIFKGDLTTMEYPNCLAVNSNGQPLLDSVNHESHAVDRDTKPCPSSHPYRIPQISYLIHWNGGTLTTSTPVSIGNGQWGPAGQHMHADYFAAVQNEFNFHTSQGKALIDLCLNDVPLSVDMASPRCGVGV